MPALSAERAAILRDAAEMEQASYFRHRQRLANQLGLSTTDLDRERDHLRNGGLPAAGGDVPPDSPRSPIRTLREILAGVDLDAEVPSVAGPIAYRGRVVLLSAREKRGKSTIGHAAAAYVSNGNAFLNGPRPEGPANVLILGFEEHQDDAARTLMRFGADPDRIHIVNGLSDINELPQWVERVKPTLMVIDTLSKFAEKFGERIKSGDGAAWTAIMSKIAEPTRQHEIATLVIHHLKKDETDYRDSNSIGASVDLLLNMSDHPGGVRRFKALGRWTTRDFAVRLIMDPERWRYELLDGKETTGSREKRDAILEYVHDNPGNSRNAVRKHVGGRKQELNREIDALVAEGIMIDTGSSEESELYIYGLVPDSPISTPSGTTSGTT